MLLAGGTVAIMAPGFALAPFYAVPTASLLAGSSSISEARQGNYGTAGFDLFMAALPWASKTVRTGVVRGVSLREAHMILNEPASPQALGDMVTGNKVAASTRPGNVKVSGYTELPVARQPAGYRFVPTARVMQFAEWLGRPFRRAGGMDYYQGVEWQGRYYSAHAEPQALAEDPHAPVIHISRSPCLQSCGQFVLPDTAIARGYPLVAWHNEGTTVFMPGGTGSYSVPGSGPTPTMTSIFSIIPTRTTAIWGGLSGSSVGDRWDAVIDDILQQLRGSDDRPDDGDRNE
jgi:hypothetical protein